MSDIRSIEANAQERRLNNINQCTASREERKGRFFSLLSLSFSFQQIDDDDDDELFLPSE